MADETAEAIAADLAELRAARTALATGNREDAVMHSGRRMDFGKVSMRDLTDLIAIREQDYERAVNREAGNPVRSAITFGFRR